ncbi:MAG: TRAP transporter substrate-binding protein DctP [Chloroflexi bacterium]|nr:TRAP transporter substrate-binding protein DctP [Chloroflexota bacterium]
MEKKRIMAVRRGVWLISLLAVLSLVVACAKAAPTSTTSQAPKPSTTTTSSKPAAVTPIKWTLVVVNGPADLVSKQAVEYAAEVKKRTEGRLDIKVSYPGELPLKAGDMLKAVRDNTVQISHIIPSFVSGDSPLLTVVDIPGSLGLNRARAAIMEKAARPYLETEYGKRWNSTLLTMVGSDAAQIWSKKPINTLADLKGQRIRVSSADDGKILEGVGVAPQYITIAELSEAVGRGLVDGLMLPPSYLLSTKIIEVVNYGYVVNRMGAHPMFVVNNAALKGLSAADQKTLVDTGKYFEPIWQEQFGSSENAAWTDIKKKVSVVQPTDAEIALLRKLAAPVATAWAEKAGPEAQAGLADIRKALGD